MSGVVPSKFHPKAVTAVMRHAGVLFNKYSDGNSRFGLQVRAFTLALFEPAWCQPVHEGALHPRIEELHDPTKKAAKDLDLSRVFRSGAFALHYHRAGDGALGPGREGPSGSEREEGATWMEAIDIALRTDAYWAAGA